MPNKAQFVELLAERLDGDKKKAQAALDAVIDTVYHAVSRGERVVLTGFGVFEKRERAARTARNPATGATVKVKKTSVPAFRAGAEFKAITSGAKKLAKAPAKTCGSCRQEGRRPRRRAAEGSGQEGCRPRPLRPGRRRRRRLRPRRPRAGRHPLHAAKKAAAKKAPAKKAAAKKTTARKTAAEADPLDRIQHRDEGRPQRRPSSSRSGCVVVVGGDDLAVDHRHTHQAPLRVSAWCDAVPELVDQRRDRLALAAHHGDSPGLASASSRPAVPAGPSS